MGTEHPGQDGWVRRALPLMLLTIAPWGCGGSASGCTGPVREALDPQAGLHVLDPAATITYLSDPPTSGPHLVGDAPTGLVAEPLADSVQISILERGDVLVQYRPDLEPDERAAVESLALGGTVVAPDPDLDDPIVATAYSWKLTCRQLDLDALDRLRERGASASPHAPG
jgi:hypothetical protein